MTDADLRVLHALKLRGLADTAGLATMTGHPTDDVSAVVTALAGAGLVRERTGRLTGWSLTPEGKAAHADRIGQDVTAAERESLNAAYAAFLPINVAFKEICTDWQIIAGTQTPNDHSDAAYDGQVVDRLTALHDETAPVLAAATTSVARFGRYAPRLDAALSRVRSGETAAFARPMSDSYHDVWMELHEDFLVSLGRARDAADGH